MATQGAKVLREEYNNLYNLMIGVLGNGSSDRGYGQAPNSVVGSVAAGDKITRAHWANLRIDLLRIAGHQGLSENVSWTSGNLTSIPPLPTVTATTKISANVVNQFSNAATVLSDASNVFKLAVGQYSDESLISSTRTASWNGTIRHYFTCNFTTANNARYFFNSGGRIRINPSFSPSSSTSINNDWLVLVGNNTTTNPGVGTLSFGHTNTTRFTLTSSESETSSIGFYDLTNSPTQIYTRSGGSQNSFYAVNDYTVRVYCNAANNSSGTASIVYFECEFKDDKSFRDPLFPQGDESVTGTVINNVTIRRPSGTNVSVAGPATSNTNTL